jgi:hypothetical protein
MHRRSAGSKSRCTLTLDITRQMRQPRKFRHLLAELEHCSNSKRADAHALAVVSMYSVLPTHRRHGATETRNNPLGEKSGDQGELEFSQQDAFSAALSPVHQRFEGTLCSQRFSPPSQVWKPTSVNSVPRLDISQHFPRAGVERTLHLGAWLANYRILRAGTRDNYGSVAGMSDVQPIRLIWDLHPNKH